MSICSLYRNVAFLIMLDSVFMLYFDSLKMLLVFEMFYLRRNLQRALSIDFPLPVDQNAKISTKQENRSLQEFACLSDEFTKT